MAQTFQIDANGDVVFDGTGNLVMLTGIDAVAQNTVTAMRAQRGEMQYNLTGGMPMAATAFNKYDPVAFEAAARKVIRAVDGVTGITAFSISSVNNALTYTATITTTYGTTTITG